MILINRLGFHEGDECSAKCSLYVPFVLIDLDKNLKGLYISLPTYCGC